MASPPSSSYAAPGGGARSQKRARPSDLHGSDTSPSALDFHHEDGEDEDDDDDGGDDGDKAPKKSDKKAGRRKIKIEFIQDKSRRHITFSKRKAGIMKKAYELSTLTGTQVLLLVVSETGLVYTFTTAKLQPLVTQPEGKNLIQACLNAPHGAIPTGVPAASSNTQLPSSSAPSRSSSGRSNAVGGLSIGAGDDLDDGDTLDDSSNSNKPRQRRRTSSTTSAPGGLHSHKRDGPISPTASNHSPTMPSALPSRNYTTSSSNAGGQTLSPSSTSSSLGGHVGAGGDMYRATVGHHSQHHQQHFNSQQQQQHQQQQQMMYHPGGYSTSGSPPQHGSGPAGGGLGGYPPQGTTTGAPQSGGGGGGYWNPAQSQLHAHAGVHGGRR